MRRVLITGGDGFVGRALAPALAARGVAVRCALMDSLDNEQAHEPAAIEALRGLDSVVVGDIGSETDWAAALDGVDVVIHLAGRAHVLSETASDPLAEYQRVNTAATERLACEAVKSGVGRLVFVSSIGVHGSVNREGPFKETSPIVPDKTYAQSKWEAECTLRAIENDLGLDVVILRPPLVYGPWVRGNFRRLLDWAYKGLPLPLGAVRNRRTFIGLDNLVDAFMQCAMRDAAKGKTFVVGDDASVSTPELIRMLCRLMCRPYRLLSVPEPLLRVGAFALGRGEDADRLLGSLEVDSTALRQALGWQPPVTLDEGLATMCAWYVECTRRHG